MEVGEDTYWVPPLRKYSGIPSLGTFRRATLTPWNSQDSSGSISTPQSPTKGTQNILTRNCIYKNQRVQNEDKQSSEMKPAEITDVSNFQARATNELIVKENAIDMKNKYESVGKKSNRKGTPNLTQKKQLGNYNVKKINSVVSDLNLQIVERDSVRLGERKVKEHLQSPKHKEEPLLPRTNTESNIVANRDNSETYNSFSRANFDIISSPFHKKYSKNENDKEEKLVNYYQKNNLSNSPKIDLPYVCKSEKKQHQSSNFISKTHEIDTENKVELDENTPYILSKENCHQSEHQDNFAQRIPTIAEEKKQTMPLKYKEYQTRRKFNRAEIREKPNFKEKNIVTQEIICNAGSDSEIIENIETECNTQQCEETLDENPINEINKAELTNEIKISNDFSMENEGVNSDINEDITDEKATRDSDTDINKSKENNREENPEIIVSSSCDEDNKIGNEDELKNTSNGFKRNSPSILSPQHFRIHGCTLTKEKLKKLRSIVDKAAQRKKIFTIFGKYPSIREALVSRGWVQNFDLQKLTLPHARHNDNEVSVYARLRLGPGVGEEELTLISRMLKDTPVHFVWIMGDTIDWKSLSKSTIVSRFPRVYFTTKVGLCSYLEESHWFCESSVSQVNFPRCYTTDDLAAFIKDFRLTACLGLIRTLISSVDNKQPNIFSGKIPLSAIKFAVKRCSEFISVEEHEDIDMESEEKVWDHQWDQFLTYYYQLIHEGETFVSATDIQIKALYSCCQAAVDGVKTYWPQLEMDGVSNLWLVKPGAKSRGRGISVCNKLEMIMSKLGSSSQPSTDINPPASSSRFVIQKYVEKPLLIHNTKFDIRQWFLVTSAYPLTIWMYKESYLRFCSQLFSLNNLHESVHLTNNAVQCRYRNYSKRDQALPDENMWDSYTFQAFLRTLGRRDEWESKVYPGMRESITGALLAAQDHMEPRPNCFELYGADFILTEDLKPWLIEINSSPAMAATTSVTARMCPQCLEDVIKVIIDRRANRDAPTGQFELIYRQNVSIPQPYMGMNLTVRGSAAPRGKVPPASWHQSSLDIQQPSHLESIQTALNSLADHLISESELLINSDEHCATSLTEEEKKDSSELNEKTNGKAAETSRKRVERRCTLYKKHSCQNSSHISYSPFSCNSRSHRLFKKQMRINSVLLSMRRVSVTPTSELLDWRQRAETARAFCSSAVARMTGQICSQTKKKVRPDSTRSRKSGKKNKTKVKGRTKRVDSIHIWNEQPLESEDKINISISNENVGMVKEASLITINSQYVDHNSPFINQKDKNKSTVNEIPKNMKNQVWSMNDSHNKIINSKDIFPEMLDNKASRFSREGEIEVIIKHKKEGVTLSKTLRSSSQSPITYSQKSTCSLNESNKRPIIRKRPSSHQSAHRSSSSQPVSPRITKSSNYLDFTVNSKSLEPNTFLRTLSTSDFNNNCSFIHSLTTSKYIFKSTSMINLPALLKSK